jgi:hypothetical protein
MPALLAALVLGMPTGWSEDGKPVTEVRLPYGRLIVGTWVRQDTGVVLTFHRGTGVRWPGALPVEGRYALRGLILVYTDGSMKERWTVVRLDGRELVLENDAGSQVRYLRQ